MKTAVNLIALTSKGRIFYNIEDFTSFIDNYEGEIVVKKGKVFNNNKKIASYEFIRI